MLEYFKYPLAASGYVTNGWARSICVFIWHVRIKLRLAGLHGLGDDDDDDIKSDADDETAADAAPSHSSRPKLAGDQYNFLAVFPQHGFRFMQSTTQWNKQLFADTLSSPRRFFAYHEYKRRLPSISHTSMRKQNDDDSRFSFVLNAFCQALDNDRDFEK